MAQETEPGELRTRRSGQSVVTVNDLIKAALVPSMLGIAAMMGLYWRFEENRANTAATLTRIETKVDVLAEQIPEIKSKSAVMDWRMQQMERGK